MQILPSEKKVQLPPNNRKSAEINYSTNIFANNMNAAHNVVNVISLNVGDDNSSSNSISNIIGNVPNVRFNVFKDGKTTVNVLSFTISNPTLISNQNQQKEFTGNTNYLI